MNPLVSGDTYDSFLTATFLNAQIKVCKDYKRNQLFWNAVIKNLENRLMI